MAWRLLVIAPTTVFPAFRRTFRRARLSVVLLLVFLHSEWLDICVLEWILDGLSRCRWSFQLNIRDVFSSPPTKGLAFSVDLCCNDSLVFRCSRSHASVGFLAATFFNRCGSLPLLQLLLYHYFHCFSRRTDIATSIPSFPAQ